MVAVILKPSASKRFLASPYIIFVISSTAVFIENVDDAREMLHHQIVDMKKER